MRLTAASVARQEVEALDPQIAEAIRVHVAVPLRDVLRELGDTPEPTVLRSAQRRISSSLGALQTLAPERRDLEQAAASLTEARALFDSVPGATVGGALRRWQGALKRLHSSAGEPGAPDEARAIARASVLPSLEAAIDDLGELPPGYTVAHALHRVRDRWAGLPEQIAATGLPGSGDSAALVRAGLRALATAPTLPVGRVIGHVARARRLIVDACA